MCPHTPEDYNSEEEVRKPHKTEARSPWTARTSGAPDDGEGRRSP